MFPDSTFEWRYEIHLRYFVQPCITIITSCRTKNFLLKRQCNNQIINVKHGYEDGTLILNTY